MNLILEIYKVYDSITSKQPYTDIMKVVHFLEMELASNDDMELKPSRFRVSGMPMTSLIHQKGQYAYWYVQ